MRAERTHIHINIHSVVSPYGIPFFPFRKICFAPFYFLRFVMQPTEMLGIFSCIQFIYSTFRFSLNGKKYFSFFKQLCIQTLCKKKVESGKVEGFCLVFEK
uniref:Uncharacterized protein n=1 Tax=Cacopsylla melanoneura TaxID=428564 RepID=A0A8D8XHS1_9HEMI